MTSHTNGDPCAVRASRQCDSRWPCFLSARSVLGAHRIDQEYWRLTAVNFNTNVEVVGISRHVTDLRRVSSVEVVVGPKIRRCLRYLLMMNSCRSKVVPLMIITTHLVHDVPYSIWVCCNCQVIETCNLKISGRCYMTLEYVQLCGSKS